jgi:signal transduction histidine kinase
MTDITTEKNRRILIIDDLPAIHTDFRKVLNSRDSESEDLLAAQDALFGETTAVTEAKHFEIDSAYQGTEGLANVQRALAEGRPYALAFVDARMPPGWDGWETISRIWKVDTEIQIVLCTAYSDYSWEELIASVGHSDRLLILKKPFEGVEVLQLANALTEKWDLLQAAKATVKFLEKMVTIHRENEEQALRALEREQELHQMKSRFVTMVSHEFRTPLGVVSSAAHLLDRYFERLSGDERSANIREIKHAVERMVEMMENFLMHGKLQAGQLACKPTRTDVAALCRKVISGVSNYRGVPRVVKCHLAAEAREAVVDARILDHVLGNLLTNALKYSPEESSVTLKVERTPGELADAQNADGDSPEILQVTVTDSGIGIPCAELPKLFQTFHRASNVGQRPGTGMGLAIVKQCVDAHGGTIRLESEEGRGTSVCVRLPLTGASQMHTAGQEDN